MKKIVSVLVLMAVALCMLGAFTANAEKIECESETLYEMKAGIIHIGIRRTAFFADAPIPVLFYSSANPGQIYGVHVSDSQRIEKCVWGVVAPHLYYAVIEPEMLEGMEYMDNLHLIVFSQL